MCSPASLLALLDANDIKLLREEDELLEIVAATILPARAPPHNPAPLATLGVSDESFEALSSRSHGSTTGAASPVAEAGPTPRQLQASEGGGRKRSGRWSMIAHRLSISAKPASSTTSHTAPVAASAATGAQLFPISHAEVKLVAEACIARMVAQQRDPLRELSDLFVSLGGQSDLSGTIPFHAIRDVLEAFCATAGDSAAESVLLRNLVDAPFPVLKSITTTSAPRASNHFSMMMGSGASSPASIGGKKGTDRNAQLTFGEFTTLISGLMKQRGAGAGSDAGGIGSSTVGKQFSSPSVSRQDGGSNAPHVETSPSRVDMDDLFGERAGGQDQSSLISSVSTAAYSSPKAARGAEALASNAVHEQSPGDRAQTACDKLRAKVAGIRHKFDTCITNSHFEQPRVLTVDGSVRPVSMTKAEMDAAKRRTNGRAPSMVQREADKLALLIQELRIEQSAHSRSEHMASAKERMLLETAQRRERCRRLLEQRKRDSVEEAPHWKEESLLLAVHDAATRCREARSSPYESRKLDQIKKIESRKMTTFLRQNGLLSCSDDGPSAGAVGSLSFSSSKSSPVRRGNTGGSYELIVVSDVSASFRVHATDLWSFGDLLDMLSDIVKPLPPKCAVTDVYIDRGGNDAFVPLMNFSELPHLARIKACLGPLF